MKDSYSIDIDDAGLDNSFNLHHQAYERIFARLGLNAIPVEASSGAMGGSDSVEFMVESPAGEDDVAVCDSCDYSANVERATSIIPDVENRLGNETLEKFETPNIRTIEALSESGHPPEHQIKTLVYMVDGELSLILLRGDHQFQEQKFRDSTSAMEIAPAEEETIKKALGASPGSLGAVGIDGIKTFADPSLKGRSGMTTGANEDDFHLSGVDVDRDIKVDQWVDVRSIADGEGCPSCSNPLRVVRCIEAGHIFKLGRKYSEAMGVSVLDSEGNSQIPTMGSYGIGVGRAMAAIAETCCDDSGLIWPISVAPYEVVLTVVKTDDENSMEVADKIYKDLKAHGIDVLFDDREERPGVKFADAELIGIPLRVTIGPRGLENGIVEFLDRSDPEKTQTELGVEEVKDFLLEKISAELDLTA